MAIKWMNKLTKNETEQRNVLSLGLSMVIKNADAPMITGTELQTFQVRCGLSAGQIGALGSVGQITSAIAMFLLMGVADRIKNRVRANTLLTLAMAIYPIFLVILSVGPALFRTPSFVFPTMVGMEVIDKTVLAFVGMVFMAMYARTISNRIRGRFTSIIGTVGGLIGIGCAAFATYSLKLLDFPHGFTVAFGVGVILLLAAAWANSHVREVPELCCEDRVASVSPLSAIWSIIRMREFKLLAPPNVLRGLGDGATFLAMAVGLQQLNLGVEYAGYTTMLIFIGLFLGTAYVGLTVDKFGSGIALLIADIIQAFAMVGLVLSGGPLVFLAFFLILQFAYTAESYTVPLAHLAIVPTPVIGAFSGARLMILYGATAISTPIVGNLMDRAFAPFTADFVPRILPSVGNLLPMLHLPQPGSSAVAHLIPSLGQMFEQSPAWPIFFVCAGLKVITGILYWHAFKVGKRQDAEIAAAAAQG